MQKTQQKLKAGNAAYETIREMAIEFRFRPDEKINEVELSSALGVSRTPVREALSRLVSENLVSFRRNYGFYCRSLSEPELDDLLDAIALMNRDLANRILASEPKQGLASLDTLVQSTCQRLGSLPACDVARADEAIRNALGHLQGNQVLGDLTANLNARMRFLRKIILEDSPRKARQFEAYLQLTALLQGNDEKSAQALIDDFLQEERLLAPEALSKGLGRAYLDKINYDVSLAP